jgi:D-alanyl-D-alanine carboxypeptidase
MLKALSRGLVLLLAAATPLAAQSPSLDPALAAAIDSIATQVLQSTGVPSASVAVVKDGHLAYAQAYGLARLDPRTEATPGMRYSIGSISKQFCAGLILLLQQEKKLSLDDRVSRFLPQLAHAREVTIRQLLSHTSGYQDYWPQDYVPPMMLEPTTGEAILRRWADKPLDFAPGSRWQYSNTNYVIAGLIVEKVSGKPFFEFLRSRVLAPLGMTSVLNIDLGKLPDSDPTGYLQYALGPRRPAPKEGKGWLFAAGELAMTPSDLARWDIAMMNRSLLSPASYQAMETEVRLQNGAGTGYGLGVDVEMAGGHLLVSHGGEVSGFTASNRVYPEDHAAVIVLTNQDAASAAGLIGQRIGARLFATDDSTAHQHEAMARRIFEGLQKGEIDRTLFTDNANAYFSAEALGDFASSLAPLGAPTGFTQVGQQLRGGMTLRVYRVTFADKTIRVWTFEMPDGKLEQYQVAATG